MVFSQLIQLFLFCATSLLGFLDLLLLLFVQLGRLQGALIDLFLYQVSLELQSLLSFQGAFLELLLGERLFRLTFFLPLLLLLLVRCL